MNPLHPEDEVHRSSQQSRKALNDDYHRLADANLLDGTANPHHDGCSYYFCAGQLTSASLDQGVKPITVPGWERIKALVAPAVVVHIIWWAYMMSSDKLGLFTSDYSSSDDSKDTPRWYLSVTMVFGSILAGATSVGGGAVSFPVMTLAFGISPLVARDFSLMIQSVGMVCASVTTVWLEVLVDWTAIKFSTVGGVVGIILGFELVHLSPPYAKMYFSVLWGAFASALFMLNRDRNRAVFLVLDPPKNPSVWKDGDLTSSGLVNWKTGVLLATGFVGGVFTSVCGSGIDVCSFCVLTLLFRLSEKTATPTSVIIMAVNSVVGFAYRELAMGGVEKGTYGFFLVCVPVVCKSTNDAWEVCMLVREPNT